MDINDLRGLSTVFVMIAFVGIFWWAFAPSRRNKFDDAANLPFADEENHDRSVGAHSPNADVRDSSSSDNSHQEKK